MRLPRGEGGFPLRVYFADDCLGFRQHVSNEVLLLTQRLSRGRSLRGLQRCFPIPIKSPGSGESMETTFPCASRVVRNLSLVRPAMRFRSSRTMRDVSLYLVVTEPMILRVPSRMNSFFSMWCPLPEVYRGQSEIGHSQVVAAQEVASGHSVFLVCILQVGDTLTIPELMEEQRARMRSSVPAERFAAALLMPGLLRERLRELGDSELGKVLDREVCSNLSVLAPELTVCMEAADRLCRQRAGKPLRPRRSSEIKRDEGEHLLRAESALYRGRIPHLLLPFQRDRFTSNTLMVPSVAEAMRCLFQAGFRESPGSPSMLIDCETGRPIQIVKQRIQVTSQGEPTR